ncbi:MAG TPA: ATP-binding protein, partial [Chitinophagaceae bacterium]|nr:ATP-binding protein [Chitinophagaceae bacterium]
EGAITLSRDGLILYSNSRFAHIAGRQLSTVIGMKFEDFISDEDQTMFQQLFATFWSQDFKQELYLKHNGGEKVPALLSFTPLELAEGVALSVIITDLTAIKKTQHQLEENNRQLAAMNAALEISNYDLMQFASVASHDLQEPLRKVDIFSNLLLSKSADQLPEESKRYLDKITDSVKRMKVLITDVLNYSKLSATTHSFAPVDLNEIVSELKSDFELTMKEKGASLISEQLPVIQGIKGQMRQVLQNILSNALKFTRVGLQPEILITASFVHSKSFTAAADKDGPYCIISIKDNGIGFDEKYLTNIFALFERLHGKDKFEGTGIGLAIAKKIMEKHNGLIIARSSPGEGAEFLLLLPVAQVVTIEQSI